MRTFMTKKTVNQSLQFVSLLVVFSLSGCAKSGSKIADQPKIPDPDAIFFKTQRPNIVIILADDVGYDAIAVNGNRTFETPNIDAMAKGGMRFTHVYSSPLCSPSRTAFISGKYNFRNYFTWGSFPETEKSIGNLAQEAGYRTYAAGKWSFDGGDATARRMGFDDYSLWDPFKADPPRSHYKDPLLYKNGNYISTTETKGQYGDDIFTADVLDFIHQNKSNPFFVFFPISLCHFPYSPTPEDAEYRNWDSKQSTADVKYFPSMMKYMDKKIGEIIDSLKQWNLYNNTIVMFAGDNGTPRKIWYDFNGKMVEGGKSSTTHHGTRVPLMVTWPNGIKAGSVNHNLVAFQDFFSTVSEIVGKNPDASYGTIDGISFAKQLIDSKNAIPREYVFNHYVPYSNNGNDKLRRWINDTTYKLYDQVDRFYNISLDPEEVRPIKKSERTAGEKQLVDRFQKIMDQLK